MKEVMKTRTLQRVEVTEQLQIAPAAYYLKLPPMPDFIPGQVIALSLWREEPPRIYSIASGTTDDHLGILYNIKPGGSLTPRMAQLKSGDPVFVSEPYGAFYGSERPSVWIATGTGIAPFRSMMRSGLLKKNILLHGARHLRDHYFTQEFAQMMGPHYIRICSREDHNTAFRGRVTDYLTQMDPLPKDYKYYLCGNAEMVVEVRDLLIARGVSYQDIVAEIYF